MSYASVATPPAFVLDPAWVAAVGRGVRLCGFALQSIALAGGAWLVLAGSALVAG